MRFRHLIAEAAGPADGGTEFFSRVWDALYDGVSAGEINTPEELGPVLRSVLGLDLVAP